MMIFEQFGKEMRQRDYSFSLCSFQNWSDLKLFFDDLNLLINADCFVCG